MLIDLFLCFFGELMYSNTRLVISSTERQQTIISDDPTASHCGKDSVIQKISNRFFWYNIKGDVEKFFKFCEQCQRKGKIEKKSSELHSIPIKTDVMQQVGINICSFSKVDGFKHLVVCKECFSKWSESKPIKDKSVSTITQLLYEIICQHLNVWRFSLMCNRECPLPVNIKYNLDKI